jgi:hypothetical protein
VPASEADAEAVALAKLSHIADGSQCLLADDTCWPEHRWVSHEGIHGEGRACERCFMTQATRPSIEILFKIQPTICESAEPPTAVGLLSLWRAELDRVRAGGCIASGEHRWVDVQRTLVRVTGAGGRCCDKCGVVRSVGGGAGEAAVLLLPNLVGRFGPPISKEYRSVYGGERMEVPRGKELVHVDVGIEM